MGRPRTGKISKGELRVKRPNGDVYVYEREVAYNPETKKTFTAKKRLLGKIPAGSTELVPTRPKKSPVVNKELGVNADMSHIGATGILKWVGQRSGITQALSACFSEGDAGKIETIAQYWITTNGAELPGLESWQLTHQTPYPHGMSEQTYGRLFNDIALNESGIQQYFLQRASVPTGQRKVLAVDSTTVDTYSTGQLQARHGFSKDGSDLPAVKLLTIMEASSLQPIAFRNQPGNVPDVLSIKNSIKELDYLMEKTPLVVTDCGFMSEENLLGFVRHSIPTLTRMKLSAAWIRNTFDEIKGEITRHANACPFDSFTFGVSRTIKHEFKILRQRTRGEYRAGETQLLTRNLHVHFFYDDAKATSDRAAFRAELRELKALVEAGASLSRTGQRKAERFLIVKESKSGRTVEYNDEAIHDRQAEHGFFVLVSNSEKETWEALRCYRLREKIEELFAAQKSGMDGRRPRVWTPERLRGRQFVQFVGLGYYFFFLNEIKQLKARLGVNDGTKSNERIREELALKSWLENKSVAQILQWFDAVYDLRVETPYGKRVITTETTARDELFLRELGIKPTR